MGVAISQPISIIGKKEEGEFIISPEDLNAYSHLTNDWNPLHYDEGIGRESVWGQCPAPGFLVYAKATEWISKVVQPWWAPRSSRLKITKAAFIGQAYQVKVEVPDLPVNRAHARIVYVDLEVREKEAGGLILEDRLTCFWSKEI